MIAIASYRKGKKIDLFITPLKGKIIQFKFESISAIKMNIGVNITTNNNDSIVSAHGHLCNVITENERNTFGLGDHQIKTAIESIHGKRPNDVFVRSPTPWDDLYSRFNWPQVQRFTKVRRVDVVENKEITVVVSEAILKNNSSHRGTFTTNLSTSVRNTTSSHWSQSHGISIGQKISYGFKWLDVEFGGETSFGYSNGWGHGSTQSNENSTNVGGNIQVQLEPNEIVRAQIVAKRANAKVKVEYESYLTGYVAMNYYPPYKGHHFWAWDVEEILEKNDRPNLFISTENITVELHSNVELKLKKLEH